MYGWRLGEKGAECVCFGGLSVRVLAGRACVLFRNVGFFESTAVVVWHRRPKSYD